MTDFIRAELGEALHALRVLIEDQSALERVAAAATLIAERLEQGQRVFSAGNGGSMCDAMHFAEELSGRFRKDRRALDATAFSDPGFLTCAANDFGYDQVFARAIEAHGRAGDVLVLFSTSGSSANIVAAAESAKKQGVTVIGLTGRADSPLARAAEIAIVTPAGPYADRVQELHIKIVHILIALIERHLFGG